MHLNFRYAPDRTPGRGRGAPRASSLGAAAGDPPALPRRTRRRLLAAARRGCAQAGGFALEPKQAWTNVADFAARGLDAVNLGPGATALAHTADEQVEIAALERTYDALRRFLIDEAPPAMSQ